MAPITTGAHNDMWDTEGCSHGLLYIFFEIKVTLKNTNKRLACAFLYKIISLLEEECQHLPLNFLEDQ